MADDISKRIEKLLETLQTRAKSIEIGSVRVTKEDIKNQEILLKQLIEERKEAVRKNEIKGDEVEKTQSLIDKNKELLRLLKQSRTLTGQFAISISSVANNLMDLITDFPRQYKIAEDIARQYKQMGVYLGDTGKNAKIMEQAFKDTLPAFTEMGLDANDLRNVFQDISDETGKRVNITSEEAKIIGAVSEGLGTSVSQSTKLAESFILMGVEGEKIEEYIFETYKTSQKMGLNAGKVIRVLSDNIKSMQTYSFVNGVKGMTEMAKQAVKMRMDVSDVLQMADKFYQPEAAIEAAAELQLLGGEIADAFGDPFTIMYEARNKPEELAKRIQDMTKNMLQLNKETGEYELPAEARMQFQSLGKTLGLNVDKMIEMSRQTAKIRDFKMKFTQVGDEDMKESLATMAKMKDGKMVVEYKDEEGKKREAKLEDVTEEMAKTILDGNKTQEENLYDIARNTKVMSDELANFNKAKEQQVSLTSNIYESTVGAIKESMIDPMKKSIESLVSTATIEGKAKVNEYLKNREDEGSVIEQTTQKMKELGEALKDKTLKALEDFKDKLEEVNDYGLGRTQKDETEDIGFGGSGNDAILTDNGKFYSFDSKDSFLAAKPGGVIQQVLQDNYIKEKSEKIVKVDFGKLDLNITSNNPNMNFSTEQKNQLITMITERIGKSLYNNDISGGNPTDGKSRILYNT